MDIVKLKPNDICHCSDNKTKLLQVKIINKCNGNCWFCIDKNNYNPNEVNTNKMIQTILSEPEYKTVDLTGGEPFLDFDVILKVLKAIRPYKDFIVLNTNGLLLTEKKVKQLNGLIDVLKIALHHYDENANAKIITTKVSFENIKNALKHKKFKTIFNMVITKAMEEEKECFVNKLVTLCHELFIDAVSMNEIRYSGVNNGYPQYAKDHVEGYNIFKKLNIISYKNPEELITQGCIDDFEYRGIEFRLKRLCGYKLKSKVQTFKVIYSNGEIFDDWVLNI